MLSPPNPKMQYPGLKTGLVLEIPGSPKKCRLMSFWLVTATSWVGGWV